MQALPTPADIFSQEEAIKSVYPQLFSAIAELACASDAELASRFPQFIAELERDFAMEEEWMDELRCNELRYHREQHAELLRLLHHAHNRTLSGDFTLARKVTALLPQWFSVHIGQMDMVWASATHTSQQQQAAPALRQAA